MPAEEAPPVEEPLVEKVELQQNGTNFPAIWSEEGKYLASVLGDALVKGLSLVSQERPHDPVEYLSNFLRKYKDDGEEVETDGGAEVATAAAVVAGAVAAGGLVEEGVSEEPVAEVEGEKEVSEAMVEQEVEAAALETPAPEVEETPEVEEPTPSPHVPSTPVDAEPIPEEKQEEPQSKPAEQNEESLNTELTEAYDKLEDALEEEEASTEKFDPVKEELTERAMLESSRADATDDGDISGFIGQNSTRDESGQSVLHFACTRPGGGSTIMAFLQNPSVNLAWRDLNLRTARDVASSMNRNENVRVIDNYVVMLAQRGDYETVEALMVDGYEHLADVEDGGGVHVVDVAEGGGFGEVARLLRGAPEFRERVERVQRCVRSGDIDGVKSLVGEDKRVGYGVNPRTGRHALHVAVLCEEVGIVKWLSENCGEGVKRGDNVSLRDWD